MKTGLNYRSDRGIYQDDMSKEEKQVLIRLSDPVHEAVAADADRCNRSIKGQVEAILTEYYRLHSVELFGVDETRRRISPELQDRIESRQIEGGGVMTNWRIPVTEPANQMDKKSKKRNSA